MAEITYLGHSCFRIKGKEATIITDPFSRELGYKIPVIKADIVTISHNDAAHNHDNLEIVKGEPRILQGPGEYEMSNVFITGFRTFHDTVKGKERGFNTIYLFELEGLRICHLGDLGHTLTADQVEGLGNVDILFIPVGGHGTIDAVTASEVIGSIEPRVVIPMHYRTEATSQRPFDGVERFCKEMGLNEWSPQDKLLVKAENLPSEMQVLILEYKS